VGVVRPALACGVRSSNPQKEFSKVKDISRRNFLKSSLDASAALGVPAASWGRVPGANDAIRIDVAGFNGRGRSHIEVFFRMEGVRLVALCDPDRDVLEREVERLRGKGNQEVRGPGRSALRELRQGCPQPEALGPECRNPRGAPFQRALPHGKISHRLGRTASPDEIREAIKGDKAAMESYERFQAHLAANGVDLGINKATLGVFSKMDPKAERFIGNDNANEMLARACRAPFVVPQKV
jgi:hypothetical protein